MRERDLRNAIKTALDATNLFDTVWLGGLEDPKGIAASDSTGCGISPNSTVEDLRGGGGGYDAATDGGILYSCRIDLEIIARNEDSQVRDELAEQLLNTAKNTLNGTDLGGLAFPQLTKVSGWTWKKATSSERLIVATLMVRYEDDGWQAADVAE